MIKFNIDNSVGNNDFSESVKLYYNELKKYQKDQLFDRLKGEGLI